MVIYYSILWFYMGSVLDLFVINIKYYPSLWMNIIDCYYNEKITCYSSFNL